jgi:excisionase family DNA binding protein|tara:strand:+ start:30 stop:236 length:207 start_codon:yes stop_codon:yes gene_type:complete
MADWTKVRTAAAAFEMAPRHLYDAIKRGELPHVRLSGGRSLRVRRSAVEQWLLSQETTGPGRTRGSNA